MDQFDIIGALEAFSATKGWNFYYKFDNFHANSEITGDMTDGKWVLVADFKIDPTFTNAGRFSKLTYTCLLMLGRKFDPDGTPVSMDETSKQKYDRRLKELVQGLAQGMAEFACGNELEISSFPLSVDINVFDTNMDFAIAQNAVFVQ